MYKSKQRQPREKFVSFQLVKVFLATIGFGFATELSAVPEQTLADRGQEIDEFFATKMKIASFEGKDGVRLSYAFADGDPSLPPIVISVGLGESYAHYKEYVYDFMAKGDLKQAFFVFDLRSQGYSQKLAPDEGLFHVDSFEDYVSDLELFLEKVVRPGYPLKARIMAHSNGGLIAFFLIARRPELAERVIYVAPLFGLNYGGMPAWTMRFLANTLDALGYHNKGIPFRGQGLTKPFAQNSLTYSEPRYNRMLALLQLDTFKGTKGPSVGYVVAAQEALANAFEKTAGYTVPSVVLTADEDAYVSTAESERYCKAMSGCELVPYKHARHVLLHERDEVRDSVMEKIKDVLVVKPEVAP
jgi:lysophospholipase